MPHAYKVARPTSDCTCPCRQAAPHLILVSTSWYEIRLAPLLAAIALRWLVHSCRESVGADLLSFYETESSLAGALAVATGEADESNRGLGDSPPKRVRMATPPLGAHASRSRGADDLCEAALALLRPTTEAMNSAGWAQRRRMLEVRAAPIQLRAHALSPAATRYPRNPYARSRCTCLEWLAWCSLRYRTACKK